MPAEAAGGPEEAPRRGAARREEPPRTAREMLGRARGFLEQRGVEGARLEAEILVAHALGLDRLHLFLELERPVARAELERARELLVRRGRGEPSAYLTGLREFYGRTFAVGPAVLIPRPETELVVDLARERLAGAPAPRLADLGTGSGCLAITLALELEKAEVVASDVSAPALACAAQNAQRLGARVRFVEGDGLAALAPHAPFDWIVSNPPYVDPAEAGALAREVREHEPAGALFGPAGDPDRWARTLAAEAGRLLRPGGGLLVELGQGQAARLAPALARMPHALHRDLAGVERVLEVRVPR